MGATDLRNGQVRQVRPGRVTFAVREPGSADVLRLSLATLMVIEVSRVHGQFPIIATLRPLLVLTLVALLATLLNPRALTKYPWWKTWQAKALIGLAVATIGSIPFGISPGGSAFFFRDSYSKTLLGAFLLIAAIRNARDLRLFAWAYVIGTAILVWMALFMFEMSTQGGVTRLSGLETWDANDLGVLLLMGLPLCGLLFQTSKSLGKTCAAIVLLGVGAAIARSGSRGAFVGFVAVLAAYLISMKGTKVSTRIGIVAVILGGLMWAAPQGYWKQMQTIIKPEEDYNWDATQGRRQLAIRGIGYMLGRPVFGIGIDNFGRAEATISSLAKAREEDPNSAGIKWSVAHNSYIQVGAELGIPGALLYCTLVIGCLVAPYLLRRKIPQSWRDGTPDQRFLYQAAVYLPVAGIGYAIPTYFVTFCYNDPIYILAAFTAALAACVKSELLRASSGPSLGRSGSLVRAAVAGRRGLPRLARPLAAEPPSIA